MDWQETIVHVSDRVFPGINQKPDDDFVGMSELLLSVTFLNVYKD